MTTRLSGTKLSDQKATKTTTPSLLEEFKDVPESTKRWSEALLPSISPNLATGIVEIL
jgi:hypothetical protein